jgi:hypothetical protein
MFNTRFFALVGVILFAAVMRLVPHPPNFAPITAMALFGGAYFPGKATAFAIPLAAMALSDLVLGYAVYDSGWFHATLPFTYASFLITVWLGLWIKQRRTPLRIGAAALTSSVLFFAITNFGVWLVGGLYPRTFEGLTACYIAAIPFFQNTLLGDLTYTAVLFGGFAFMQRYFPMLRRESAGALARMGG